MVLKLTRRAERPYTFALVTKYDLKKNFNIAGQGRQPGKPKSGTSYWHNNCLLEMFHLLNETRKATGFKTLGVNCSKINQVTSKCQMDIFGNRERSKIEKLDTPLSPIEFCILKMV